MPILGPTASGGSASRARSSNGGSSSGESVEDAGDPERLAELARAGAERALRLEPAPLAHRLEPVRRLERPHERRLGASLLGADEVEAPVDAVRAIDVRVARRPEHRGRCARSGRGSRGSRDRPGRTPRPRRSSRQRRRRAASRRSARARPRAPVRAKNSRVSRSPATASLRTAARARPASRSSRARAARGARGRGRRTSPRRPPSRRAPRGRARRRARPRRGRVLAHVVQDRALGAAGEDRLRDAVDPDARPPAAASLVARDRLERVDPVGARPLAEAEEDHPRRAVRHARIIARCRWTTRRTCPRASTAARTCRGSAARSCRRSRACATHPAG